jgi:hypothetical protein
MEHFSSLNCRNNRINCSLTFEARRASSFTCEPHQRFFFFLFSSRTKTYEHFGCLTIRDCSGAKYFIRDVHLNRFQRKIPCAASALCEARVCLLTSPSNAVATSTSSRSARWGTVAPRSRPRSGLADPRAPRHRESWASTRPARQ